MKYKRLILSAIVLVLAVFNGGCAKNASVEAAPAEKVKYVLTLNLEGGALPDGNIIEFFGGEDVPLPEPEREGYTFDGWYYDSGFNGPRCYYIDAKYANSDIELWAKWIKNAEPGPGPDTDPEPGPDETVTYKIKYVLNGGSFPDGSGDEDFYVEGREKTLKIPQKDSCRFLGWYEDINFSLGPVETLGADCRGNKTFYALWEEIHEEPEPEVHNIVFMLNGGEFEDGAIIPENYRSGDEILLPVPVYENHEFGGWFENPEFSGSPVLGITANDSGDKIFYARWTEIKTEPPIKIKDYGGLKESAYVIIVPDKNINAGGYAVQYKDVNGFSGWKSIDSLLIRSVGEEIRADILGLKAGNYQIKVEVGGDSVTLPDVTVVAYNRAVEACEDCMLSGLGGYNYNGTVKSGAQIIYVDEENKNTVEAEIGGNVYTGIAGILSAAGSAKNPLVIRIIGQVSAATWNYLAYSDSNVYNGKMLIGSMAQSELLRSKFNTLNTENYSILEGLKSKITVDGGHFDSFWNMCETEGASNITVEGVGPDAVIFQWGFAFYNCSGVEIRNLTFRDYPENACLFEGNPSDLQNSKNIWIHDNNFEEGKNYWNVSPDASKAYGDGDLVLLYVSLSSSEDNKFAVSRSDISRV